MDTVRADLVSGYGESGNTPVLAEIASEGVLFQNSYAASTYTIPSTMSIFTGLEPIDDSDHHSADRCRRIFQDLPRSVALIEDEHGLAMAGPDDIHGNHIPTRGLAFGVQPLGEEELLTVDDRVMDRRHDAADNTS
jgi:hypothetical protein